MVGLNHQGGSKGLHSVISLHIIWILETMLPTIGAGVVVNSDGSIPKMAQCYNKSDLAFLEFSENSSIKCSCFTLGS